MNTSGYYIIIICITCYLFSACNKTDGKRDRVSDQYTVTTLAGNGIAGFVDGPGSSAQFKTPTDIAVDGQGNVYVADMGNFALRKITPTGVVTTIAGGSHGYADGQGSAAQFYSAISIALDGQGNLYVADRFRIRKVTPAGIATTLAGGETNGNINGEGSLARFNEITDIAVDGQGNVFVIDNGIQFNEGLKIRKVTPSGIVSTFNEVGLFAGNIWFGSDGDMYFVSGFVQREVVKLSSNGTKVSVIRLPDYTMSVVSDNQGTFYFTQGGPFTFSNEGKVFMIDESGKTTTIAGTGQVGYAEGKGNAAIFNYPTSLTLDAQRNIYVIDAGNHRIRKISL